MKAIPPAVKACAKKPPKYTESLLEMPPLCRLVESVSHGVVVSGIRTYLEGVRRELKQENGAPDLPAAESLAESIASWITAEDTSTLQPVINATGILLHTGLGRAPLADAAISAINEIAHGYASVEVDLESGHRSQRVLAVESLLKELTGAEAAAVVNIRNSSQELAGCSVYTLRNRTGNGISGKSAE